jgi:hypothetical protein
MYRNKTNDTKDIFFDAVFYEPINNPPKMDWSNYAAMILLLVLIAIGIISSLVSKASKSTSKPIAILKSFSLLDNF